jgi:hypothetical protein
VNGVGNAVEQVAEVGGGAATLPRVGVTVSVSEAAVVVPVSRLGLKNRFERREEIVVNVITGPPGGELVVGLLDARNLFAFLGLRIVAKARAQPNNLAIELAANGCNLASALVELSLELVDRTALVLDPVAPEGDSGCVVVALARLELLFEGREERRALGEVLLEPGHVDRQVGRRGDEAVRAVIAVDTVEAGVRGQQRGEHEGGCGQGVMRERGLRCLVST